MNHPNPAIPTGKWRKSWSLRASVSSPRKPMPAEPVSPRAAQVKPPLSPRRFFLGSLGCLDGLPDDDEAVSAETNAPTVTARASVRDLPSELVQRVCEMVAERKNDFEADPREDLRTCALVCTAWSEPARRVLFGEFAQAITSADSLVRLRRALERSPQLGRYMRKVDLSALHSRGEPKRTNDLFRRAAGLLRETPAVRELALVHVAMSPTVKAKFFGALAELKNVKQVRLSLGSSPMWINGRSPRSAASATRSTQDESDIVALCSSLANWTKLETLALNGYNHSPHAFSYPSAIPRGVRPSYKLRSLHLVSTAICPAALLFLLGQSATSLDQLTLSSVRGLTPALLDQVFALVGGSLTELNFSVDAEDFEPEEGQTIGALDGSFFAHLRALETLTISTDSLFSDALLSHLATLPNLATLSLCVPHVAYGAVSAFVTSDVGSLRAFTLDPWEASPADWTDKQRWDLLSACEDRKVAFALNAMSKAMIEEAWFGIDLGSCQGTLELDWPRGKAPLGMRSWYQS